MNNFFSGGWGGGGAVSFHPLGRQNPDNEEIFIFCSLDFCVCQRMDITFTFRPVWEPSVFGTAGFLGLRLIQAFSVTFGSSIVYKIMP